MPVHVVAVRLGHADPSIALRAYAHDSYVMLASGSGTLWVLVALVLVLSRIWRARATLPLLGTHGPSCAERAG